MGQFKNLLLLFFVISMIQALGLDHNWKKSKLEKLEELTTLGSGLPLVGIEKQMNNIFMSHKRKEIEDAKENPTKFAPFNHFFKMRRIIEQRKLFKIMKLFPKGANLHVHDFGMVKTEFLFNLTYSPNLYVCLVNQKISFKFMQNADKDLSCEWELLEKLREKNAKFIDKVIKSQLSLIVDDPDKTYKSKEYQYDILVELVNRIYSLVTHKALWKSFIKQGLKETLDDNMLYMEIKTMLPPLYDVDGTVFDAIHTARMCKEAIEEFKKENKDFIGARIIYAPIRDVDTATAEKYASTAIELKKKFHDHFAGFDLVGWEDKGKTIGDFDKQIELMKKHGVKFFFHAGETNFFGTHADENLFDAVLFGTERIGAPVAVMKHPEILKIVKVKNIALEMLPISNQVFQFIPNIHNNPVSFLIASGYPVVIGSDIPGIWGASGLRYDWYVTCLSLTDKEQDTKVFKQLAINSINHSGMNLKEKAHALALWTLQFTDFAKEVVDLNNNNRL